MLCLSVNPPSDIFRHILNYYRTGKLHFPKNECLMQGRTTLTRTLRKSILNTVFLS